MTRAATFGKCPFFSLPFSLCSCLHVPSFTPSFSQLATKKKISLNSLYTSSTFTVMGNTEMDKTSLSTKELPSSRILFPPLFLPSIFRPLSTVSESSQQGPLRFPCNFSSIRCIRQDAEFKEPMVYPSGPSSLLPSLFHLTAITLLQDSNP